MESLWPSDILQTRQLERAPVNLLREQARWLGQSTRNLLEAEVVPLSKMVVDAHNADFGYMFWITAPPIGDYSYELFRIYHNIDLWPVRFVVDSDTARDLGVQDPSGNEVELKAEDEDKFRDALATILGSQKTRRVINGILAQMAPDLPVS